MMREPKTTFLKFISILQRNTNRYFDLLLDEYQIGGGQQFFLIRIYENDGISMYDLAKLGNFDKATVTKAVHKLSQLGYVDIRTDPGDRRIRRLYLTETGKPIVEALYQKRNRWIQHLVEGFSPEQEKQIFEMLQTMSEQSCRTIDLEIEQKGDKEQS